jgi:hypothetical protein
VLVVGGDGGDLPAVSANGIEPAIGGLADGDRGAVWRVDAPFHLAHSVVEPLVCILLAGELLGAALALLVAVHDTPSRFDRAVRVGPGALMDCHLPAAYIAERSKHGFEDL